MSLCTFTNLLLVLTCVSNVCLVCVAKLGLWSHPLHLAGRLASVLASQTDADAEDDHGRPLSVQLPGVGRPLRHCEGSGKLSFF